MESKKAVLGTLFLLVLLFASEEAAVVQQQPRVCQIRSGRFMRPCIRSVKCAETCRAEGFDGGSCMLLSCICQKAC